MKTSQIFGITAGAVVGALLLGGGAFAAGVNLGQRDDIQQMAHERSQQRLQSEQAKGFDQHSFGQDGHRGERGGMGHGRGMAGEHKGPFATPTPDSTMQLGQPETLQPDTPADEPATDSDLSPLS